MEYYRAIAKAVKFTNTDPQTVITGTINKGTIV